MNRPGDAGRGRGGGRDGGRRRGGRSGRGGRGGGRGGNKFVKKTRGHVSATEEILLL